MKLSKKTIDAYNHEDTTVVLSTYPRRGHTYDPKALAVAPFTKNKINAISRFAKKTGQPQKFIILADTIEGEQHYIENGHLVIRCWTRNLITVYSTIQKYLNLFPKTKSLVIEHEFGIFGLKHQITAQFPFFLLLNRLLGKKIILVLHQVIFDLKELSGHLQINPKSKLTTFLNYLIRANYIAFGFLASEIIVFDQALKQKLSIYVNPRKIHNLPLPNSGKHQITHRHKNVYRKQLELSSNNFYLLFAGYVTWYKGADWLVETFKKIKKNLKNPRLKLIIAGGKSSSLEIDTKYMNWYNKLVKDIEKNKDIILTDVLDEKILPKYIAAADLMIMPYRLMMSASGPFTIAQTSGTPCVVSKKLQPMTDNPQFQMALKENKLKTKDFVFDSTHDLQAKIQKAITNKQYLSKLEGLVKTVANNRSCESQSPHYLNLINHSSKTESEIPTKQLARGY